MLGVVAGGCRRTCQVNPGIRGRLALGRQEARMTGVTALLHRAACHGISIVWDDRRNSAVIFPVKNKDRALLQALHEHGSEIVELLSHSGFWSCACEQCRGTLH